MLKMSFSKIKKLCTIALIPRILRDEVSLSPRKLGKRPLDGLWKMCKSTDSNDQEVQCEKCKKLIELVFGPDKPKSLLKQVETNSESIQMDEIQKIIPPSIAINEHVSESGKLSTEQILPIDNTKEEIKQETKSIEDEDSFITKKDELSDNVFQSTTAKEYEEKLAQKMETIEEPGLVEAATPKIDGFNIPPKVLGSHENLQDNKNALCTKIAPGEDAMDEIAKKCLSSPPDKIDERILEEMKSCGMLGRGRKKPTSRRNGYHVMKSHDKESNLETKKEQSSTLYFKKEQMSSNPLHDYLPMNSENITFAHKPQHVYPAYFKNVPIALIESGRLNQKSSEQKSMATEPKDEKNALQDETNILREEKAELVSLDNDGKNGSLHKEPIIIAQNCSNIQSSEVSVKPNALDVEKPKEIIDNVEVEVEEIRVTAAETSRLGIPGDTECDPDFDSRHIKPDDIYPCNQQSDENETFVEKPLLEIAQNDRVSFSDSKDPPDTKEWYRRDSIDRPFNNPNTAISGTFPYPQVEEEALESDALHDTAISARQDPAEYYDLSHCNMEKTNDDVLINPPTLNSLAAYHQYTILTGSEKEESEDVLFSSPNTPGLTSSNIEYPQATDQKQELPKTINKDISATMGPLPQLKDMEEEVSLTEMLRRVRERNRLQYCRECAYKAIEPEPAEANKCPPPLDKGSGKTLGPGPCKPKPKPACPPPPPTCPPPASPCKPKDPCAKFSKSCLIGDKIKETFSLVLQVAFRPAYASSHHAYRNKMNAIEPLKVVVYKDGVHQAEKLGSFLLSSCPERKDKEPSNEDVILARDYEPWSPIPSWPIPKKEKKEPFVCPKEGCKIIPPPRLNPPCKENPCVNLPKRSFSLIEYEQEPLYLYTTDH